MKVSAVVREGLRKEGFGRTALSVRGYEVKGDKKVSVSVKDFYVPLTRIEKLVAEIAPSVETVVKFDYKVWNEMVKKYVGEAQEIMTARELATVYENEFFMIVYRPIAESFALERKTGADTQTIEIKQAANAYELAEAYYILRSRIVELTWRATEEAAESRKRGFVEIAKGIKEKMRLRREKVNATLKDLVLLLQCFATGDYNLIYATKLYKKHGAEYCEYLSILDEMKGELR